MNSSLEMIESPKIESGQRIDAQAETPPAWSTYEGQRRRTLLFLIFAAIYVGYHLIVPPDWLREWTGLDALEGRGWVFQPLFNGDWYYFGGDPPPWYEYGYRWFLTLLPLAAWTAILFVVLTRFRLLTHRRVAFVVVFLGLVFLEGNMRWFNMSNNHVSWNEMQAFFDLGDADLGLRSADYAVIYWQLGWHAVYLAICAFLAGPEPRLIMRALWKGAVGTVIQNTVGTVMQAIWSGPIGTTYVGIGCRWCFSPSVWLRIEAAAFRVVGCLDSKAAVACIAGLVMVDPVVIWALDSENSNGHGDRAVVRQIADSNPLRWHSLDRAWLRVVFTYSDEAQDLAAANKALREIDSSSKSTGPKLAIPGCPGPAGQMNILILQAESLSAEAFSQTDLPYLNEFAKKCVRLNRHFSAGNATHYGILGLLHGSPVTFFTGPREKEPRLNPYLEYLKEQGYKTRLITRSVMQHHALGHYLPNWTEPVSEPDGDFKSIPEIHAELARPGPRLVYSFYHATHYPYNHIDEPRFQKYQPEVDYYFNYNRPGLFEWKGQIVNRYKNTLLEMDDWCRQIIENVDLDKTIVIFTGDHGEEFFQQGRLGHCSALNIHQTMTPCLVHIPGVAPADVTFVTSHADIMPTIADALGHAKKPATLGQSLFEPVSFRYAVLSHFDYTKCKLWAVATEDRLALFGRDYRDNVELVGLLDWNGKQIAYRVEAEYWNNPFRIIRRVEVELGASRD